MPESPDATMIAWYLREYAGDIAMYFREDAAGALRYAATMVDKGEPLRKWELRAARASPLALDVIGSRDANCSLR